MKKILLAATIITILGGCFVLRKKDKYGCPTDGRNVGAEKLASGDEKAMKASRKAKFRGRKSY